MREIIFRLTDKILPVNIEKISRYVQGGEPADQLSVFAEKRNMHGRSKIAVGRRIAAARHYYIHRFSALGQLPDSPSRTRETQAA